MLIGITGLGSIGLRHAQNLIKLGHKILAYDPDPKRRNLLEKIGGEPCLHGEQFHTEAIVIASPTPNHASDIANAIDYGTSFFVEKPISDKPLILDSHDKQRFDECCKMVGYMCRFHQCVITAKGWIMAGHLGEPLWANFVVAQKNTKYTDPVILNWSHEVDLALYLLGPAERLTYAVGYKGGSKVQTVADLILLHGNGCQSTVHMDYLTQPEIRQSVIVGTDATIIMDLVGRQAWVRSSKNIILDHFVANDNWDDNYYDEMETFIARVNGQETIGCTGKEALEVLNICLTAK